MRELWFRRIAWYVFPVVRFRRDWLVHYPFSSLPHVVQELLRTFLIERFVLARKRGVDEVDNEKLRAQQHGQPGVHDRRFQRSLRLKALILGVTRESSMLTCPPPAMEGCQQS